jgi:hypothetical protein
MTISDENRARFEGLGTAEVRHELGVGYVRHLSGEQRVQAQEWLAEQDASFKDEGIEAKRRNPSVYPWHNRRSARSTRHHCSVAGHQSVDQINAQVGPQRLRDYVVPIPLH